MSSQKLKHPEFYSESEVEAFVLQLEPQTVLKHKFVKRKVDELQDVKGYLVDLERERNFYKQKFEEAKAQALALEEERQLERLHSRRRKRYDSMTGEDEGWKGR